MTTDASRKAVLPASVEKRLLSYALVAGAGIVAGSQPANATIVYVDIPDVVVAPNGTQVISIGSGLGSFSFSNTAVATIFSALAADALVYGLQSGDSVMVFGLLAGAWDQSDYVGDSQDFLSFGVLGEYELYVSCCSFPGTGPRFLGIKMVDGGNTYYGWIRISVTMTPGVGFTTTIYDWAYNTTPDQRLHITLIGGPEPPPPQPIPEPGTLGLLALGATGLVLSRLRERL